MKDCFKLRTKPTLKDSVIINFLKNTYELNATQVHLLPLGADFNTAVYQIKTTHNIDYFLKLRYQDFEEAAVTVPHYLSHLGFKEIIPPLKAKTGQLWTYLPPFKAILYPYVEGYNAITKKLSNQQWIKFGAAMKRFHSVIIPSDLTSHVSHETFSSKWLKTVKTFLEGIRNKDFKDSIAAKTAEFLCSERTYILNLIKEAENLECQLQKQSLKHILCHGDIHGWNLLVDKQSTIYMVDWDTLIFAPKERDLMFIGASIWDSGRLSAEEESLFYQGYGQKRINLEAIRYYRFERIIRDIGEYCEHIFLSHESADDKIQSFEYLQSNFRPGGPVENSLSFT